MPPSIYQSFTLAILDMLPLPLLQEFWGQVTIC